MISLFQSVCKLLDLNWDFNGTIFIFFKYLEMTRNEVVKSLTVHVKWYNNSVQIKTPQKNTIKNTKCYTTQNYILVRPVQKLLTCRTVRLYSFFVKFLLSVSPVQSVNVWLCVCVSFYARQTVLWHSLMPEDHKSAFIAVPERQPFRDVRLPPSSWCHLAHQVTSLVPENDDLEGK